MFVSDATEDLGQFIVMEIVCCIFGESKKEKGNETNNLCLQTRSIWGKSYRNASGGCVSKVKQSEQRKVHTEFLPGHLFEQLFNPTRPFTLLISLQLQF